MHRSISILGAVAVIVVASPAIAQETRSASVIATTADFATGDSRAALDKRIKSAAEEVCGANAVAEGVSWGQIKECRTQVRQDFYDKLASLRTSSQVQLSAR